MYLPFAQVEKETQFLWSQNDTTHYGERLALNFILTLKEQKAEGKIVFKNSDSVS